MAQVAVVEHLRGTARLKTIIVAGLVSLLIALLGTPLLTRLMRRHGFGQPIRVEGPKSHETKRSTGFNQDLADGRAGPRWDAGEAGWLSHCGCHGRR